MMMYKFYLPFVLSCLLPVIGLSQQSSKLSLESGATINKPLFAEERKIDAGRTTTSYDWTYRAYSSGGYFVKLAYDAKILTIKEWSFFIPVAYTFLHQTYKYHRSGYTSGCFASYVADETIVVTDEDLNLSSGITGQYQPNSMRVTCSFLISTALASRSDKLPQKNRFKQSYFRSDIITSGQISALFKVCGSFWAGPACEIFFSNLSARAMEKNYPYSEYLNYDSPSFNLTGKNILINPGVKLQFDLRR